MVVGGEGVGHLGERLGERQRSEHDHRTGVMAEPVAGVVSGSFAACRGKPSPNTTKEATISRIGVLHPQHNSHSMTILLIVHRGACNPDAGASGVSHCGRDDDQFWVPPAGNPSSAAFAMEPAMAAAQFAGFTLLTPTAHPAAGGRWPPSAGAARFTASDQSAAQPCDTSWPGSTTRYGWHLGQNLGPTPCTSSTGLFGAFDDLYQRHGNQPITLVGWSLQRPTSHGHWLARKPGAVRHVISLGSPPVSTRARTAPAGCSILLAPVHGLQRPCSVEFREPYIGPPAVPSAAIFTRGDGVDAVELVHRRRRPAPRTSRCTAAIAAWATTPLNIIADRLRLESRRAVQPRLPLGPYQAKVHQHLETGSGRKAKIHTSLMKRGGRGGQVGVRVGRFDLHPPALPFHSVYSSGAGPRISTACVAGRSLSRRMAASGQTSDDWSLACRRCRRGSR